MARPTIKVQARAVEAAGAPWSTVEERLSDPGVAWDIARSFRPPSGQAVVRVTLSVNPPSRRFSTAVGDWFADPDTPSHDGTNMKIPEYGWRFSPASRAWSDNLGSLDAWEMCSDPRWAVDFAVSMGVDRATTVATIAACARTALRHLPPDERRASNALDRAEEFARGACSDSVFSRAMRGATTAAVDAVIERGAAAHAAAASALSVTIAARPRGVRRYFEAAHAVGYACAAAGAELAVREGDLELAAALVDRHYDEEIGNEASAAALRECMRIVRARVTTLAVLRAACTRDARFNRDRLSKRLDRHAE